MLFSLRVAADLVCWIELSEAVDCRFLFLKGQIKGKVPPCFLNFEKFRAVEENGHVVLGFENSELSFISSLLFLGEITS